MSSSYPYRVYRGPAAEVPAPKINQQVGEPRSHRPLLAVLFSAVVHFVVLGGATALAVMESANTGARLPLVPAEPLHVVFVSFVLAQCGIGSIIVARLQWPIFLKLMTVVGLCGCLWLLLLAVLETTGHDKVAAGAWATSLATQAFLVWGCALIVDFCVSYRVAAAATRFSILHLLICMTLVAALLGGGRVLASRYGFVLADVPQWGFFGQLEAAACTSAALAIVTYASLHLPRTWVQFSACGLVVATIVFAAPLGFVSAYGQNAGATLVEMRWLFGSEGLFLIATLVPIDALRKAGDSLNHPSCSPRSQTTS